MSVGATAANVEGHITVGHLDKDDFAVQSLLLLGHSNTSESTKSHAEIDVATKRDNDVGRQYPYISTHVYHSAHEIKEDFLGNMRQYCNDFSYGSQTPRSEVMSKEIQKPVPKALQNHIEKITTRRRADKIAISIDGFSSMRDVCPSNHSHINEDLSNALLSSSLVLGSLSKSKKESRKSECLSASTQELPKRKRLILSPTKSNNHVESTPLPLVNQPQVADQPNHIKERKSSAERYRQRNHRRKQFFDSKLVKVVDLLQKYRLMLSAEVSQPVACRYNALIESYPPFSIFHQQRLTASTTQKGTD